MYYEWEDLVIPGIVIVVIVLLVLAIVGTVESNKKWEAYKVAHHCKVVAHIDGDVVPTFGNSSSGSMVVGVGSTPDKTGWLCDDGMTYYK